MSTRLSDKNWSLEDTTISIEEFDAIDGVHEFSKAYQDKKEALLLQVKQREKSVLKKTLAKIAAVIAVVLIVVPASVLATEKYNRKKFYEDAFGNETKKDVPKKVTQIEGNEDMVEVTLPSMEYAPVDENVADKYIGKDTAFEPIVADLGNGHTLTVNDITYNRYGGSMTYTIEREGGVTMLDYDEETNQAKGFGVNEEALCFYKISAGTYNGTGSKGYVNFETSTKEKLNCYEYFLFDKPLEKGEKITLEIGQLNAFTPEEMQKLSYDEYIEKYENRSASYPIPENIKMSDDECTFVSEKGGELALTPITLYLDMAKGLGMSGVNGYDANDIEKVEIKYKDGSSYIVEDRGKEIDNTGYSCSGIGMNITTDDGFEGTYYGITFNRIIDLRNVDYILIDDIEYRLKK